MIFSIVMCVSKLIVSKYKQSELYSNEQLTHPLR